MVNHYLLPIGLAASIGLITSLFSVLFGALVAAIFGFLFLYVLNPLRNPNCSIEIGETRPGQSKIRRSVLRKDGLIVSTPSGAKTLYEVFSHSVKMNKDRPLYGTRKAQGDKMGPYTWESYSAVNTRMLNFGSGLLNIGLAPGSRLGFYSENRADWMIAAHACEAFSLLSVSIYDTLGEENRIFIVSQSQISAVLTKRVHLKNINSLAKDCPRLKNIILFESDITEEERSASKNVGLTLYSFAEIEASGSNKPHEPIPPKPDDLAIIMYTSGTTQQPKGVLITHNNLVSTVGGVLETVPALNSDDVYLSYLPLAHILERTVLTTVLSHGARVGFFQGNIRKLDEDIKALKPTLLAGVPKVFQRFANVINQGVSALPPFKQALFKFAFSLKRVLLAAGLPTGIIDKVVFAKVREGLGGRLRLMLSGGAPLGGECHEFLRICLGCPLVQGYGLTETCGGCTITPHFLPNPYRRAGAPIGSVEVVLVDSGNYLSTHVPPQGEVCISGPSVTKGYYEMPEKTASDFKQHGDGRTWFHTGDVGQWNEDGTLSIIGRTKDIFKLDSGEYVAPERLEGIYSGSKFLANIFVYGESSKSSLVAVVVPDAPYALTWAKERGVKVEDESSVTFPNVPPSLCKNPELKKAIMEDLKKVRAGARLNTFEDVANIYVESTYWTPQTGLVTDAMKNKRPVLEKHYAEQLAQLYKEASAPRTSG